MTKPAGSLAATLIAALITLGCERPQTTTSKASPPPPTVTVAEPLKQMVSGEDEHVGRFVAVDSIEVRARVSGYLEAIHFRDGQQVEKGALLFAIDRRPFEIALEQAKANLAQAEANLALADSELQRAKSLVMGSTVTAQTMDQRAAGKRAAEAQVLAQKAAVAQARLDLEFTELRAPISGRIGDRRVSVGNLVSSATTANSSLLATIQSTDPIRFEFTLDESSYIRLKRSSGAKAATGEGAKVRLKLIDEKEFEHEGRLDFIDIGLSRSSGTIRGRAELANPSGLFAPGMFARVRIALAAPSEALLVPDAAIGSEQVRKFVLVVGPDNVAKPKYVTLGALHGGLRIVESGLEASDRVIIDGLMRARPGTPVTPKAGRIAQAAGPAAKTD